MRTYFYGWFMLPVLVLVHACTAPGQTFGVSAFFPAWIADLGLTRAQIGAAYGLGTLVASVPMTFVGAAIDRWGGRAVLVVVVACFGGACWGISLVSTVAALGVAFFFLRLLGQGSMTLVASNTLAHWFDRRLGRVAGFTSLAISGAIATLPAMNLALIEAHGWRWTYRAWGVFLLLGLLPLIALAFKNKPEDLGQRPDGARAGRRRGGPARITGMTLGATMRQPSYWIGLACNVYWSMTITAITLVLVDHYSDRGFAQPQAALAFTMFAASMAAFQVMGGFLADLLPLNRMLAVSVGGLGAGSALLGLMVAPIHGWGAMMTLGASQGVHIAVSATLWVRYFGRKNLGKIRGTLSTAMVAGSSFGPLLAGWTRDLFGRYDEVFWAMGAAGAPLAVLALWAVKPAGGPRPRTAPRAFLRWLAPR